MIEKAMTLIDSSFRTELAPTAVRAGWVDVAAAPEVMAAARGALSDAGISVTPIRLPSFEAAFAAGLAIIGAETWAAYGHLIDSGALGADVHARLLAAREITPDALVTSERRRVSLREEIDVALASVDVLALPTLPDCPPRLEAADAGAALRLSELVRPFNLSGHPSLSIPLKTSANLPVGLQLVGRRGADAALCALAHRVVD
jgi:amidase